MRPLGVKKSESVEWEKPLNGLRVAAAVSTGLKAGVNEIRILAQFDREV
jgi:hypothetical protein